MIHWKVKKFQDLTADELYTLLRLRCEIFIVEFNTPYNDLDGKDTHPETLHVMGMILKNWSLTVALCLSAWDTPPK